MLGLSQPADVRRHRKLAAFIEETFAAQGTKLRASAKELAELGRAGVNGLEAAAAVDEHNAAHYRELIQKLFVLLAQAAAGHD